MKTPLKTGIAGFILGLIAGLLFQPYEYRITGYVESTPAQGGHPWRPVKE